MSAIKNKYMFLATILLMTYVLLPFMRIMPMFIKGGIVLLSFLLSLFGAVCYGYKVKIKFFLIIILALIVNLLIYYGEYIHNGDFYFLSKYFVMFIFWLPFAYGSWYLKSDDYMSKYKIKKVIIILLTITSITTIIGSLVYPEASRLLADGNTDVHRFYQLRNIGGYGFNYALCLSVPFLVHMYKETHKIRYTLLIVLFFVCIVLCSYVFAIVLFLAILFTSVVFVHRKKRYMKILFSVFALMLLLVYIVILKNDFFWDILLNKVKENAVLYQRIGDMANYFLDKNMTGDMKYRSYLYSLSVDAFKNSPLVGNLFGKVSNLSYHSEILDFLGGTGLFGMTFMFVLLLVIFSNYKVVLKDKLFSASIIILTFVLLILSYLNTVVGSVEITGIFAFLYIPINKYNSQKSCNMEATVCLKENCLTYYLK